MWIQGSTRSPQPTGTKSLIHEPRYQALMPIPSSGVRGEFVIRGSAHFIAQCSRSTCTFIDHGRIVTSFHHHIRLHAELKHTLIWTFGHLPSFGKFLVSFFHPSFCLIAPRWDSKTIFRRLSLPRPHMQW